MTKRLPALLLLWLICMTVIPSVSMADRSPSVKHRVLYIGAELSGVGFAEPISQGYNGLDMISLLNRLGFRVSTWRTGSGSLFTINEAQVLGIQGSEGEKNPAGYVAIFVDGMSLGNSSGLMRDIRNYARNNGISLYMSSKPGGTIGNWSHPAFYWFNGSMDYTEYWAPGSDYPVGTSMPHLEATDTLWIHPCADEAGALHPRFQRIDTDSLVENGGPTTKLIWKITNHEAESAEEDTVLMWKYRMIDGTDTTYITLCHTMPDLGGWLLVSQFIRDKSYEKYRDYVPLTFIYHLDADGMDYPSNLCGSSQQWRDLATQTRNIGLSHFYCALWQDVFTDGYCDSFVAAWPDIEDVFYLTPHGTDNVWAPNRVWSYLPSDSFQLGLSTFFSGLDTLSPAPDTAIGLTQFHRYSWSLSNMQVLFRKNWLMNGNGLKVMGAMKYPTPRPNDYIRINNLTNVMRFRPCGDETTFSGDWVQIMPFVNTIGADDTLYSEYYSHHSPSVPGIVHGHYMSKLAHDLMQGEQPFGHVGSITVENVIADCFLRSVVSPFLKATTELWELDNSPEKVRQLAIRIPIP